MSLHLLPDRLNESRTDDEAAGVIDMAIRLQARRGKVAAARFLNAYGVSFRLTVRVLSEPGRRRLR